MENPEFYWEFMCHVNIFCISGATAYCLYRFVTPYLQNRKHAYFIGIMYFIVIEILYYIPWWNINNFSAYGIGVLCSFGLMWFLEPRNLCQKIFLSVTFFLLRWVARGTAANIYLLMLELIERSQRIAAAEMGWQYLIFVGQTFFNVFCTFFMIWIAVSLINKFYVDKREEMSWKELCLLLCPSLSIMSGYWSFQAVEFFYESDTGNVLDYEHWTYCLFKNLYQFFSFAAILVMTILFQSIKNRQKEQRQSEILFEQIANMKRHIGEVERLQRDIRSLKHDMGNHVTILEQLCFREEREEAQKYVLRLKEQMEEITPEICSGNPVTDVILLEKQKAAKEADITFFCDFHYPGEAVDAFDLSVILNNALDNALKAAGECENPFIRITSYRKKNVYMLEIKNSFDRECVIDAESGFPITTQGNGHGFGLANIRKVAQKYYGDLAIEQKEKCFALHVMLIVPFDSSP